MIETRTFKNHRFSLKDTYFLQPHMLPQKFTGQLRGTRGSREMNSKCPDLGSLKATNAMSRRTVNRHPSQNGGWARDEDHNSHHNTCQASILMLDPHLWPWPRHYPQRNKTLHMVNFVLLKTRLGSPCGAIFPGRTRRQRTGWTGRSRVDFRGCGSVSGAVGSK